jgi:hypothetical protein
MSTMFIHKFKWFWAWQDEKEEAWLGEMSRQGLHLRHPGVFGAYTFEQGEPTEYIYRLDFVVNARKQSDYYQLFQDAGWVHVGEMGGWQYWRKEATYGKVPEIFTDNASKIQKYQRLIGWLIIFFPIYIVLYIDHNNRLNRQVGGLIGLLYEVVFFLFFVIIIILIFAMIKILQRINALKRK